VNEQAVDNVVAYIRTFPDAEVASTIDGDVAAGAEQYRVCAYCHGKDGAGVQALNAPRLAGMSDWYLERQLKNFRDDIRGSHLQDYYGFQMGLMGQSLFDEQAVTDLVAYINTL
jgi:cytochrome c oxidase subunit 2